MKIVEILLDFVFGIIKKAILVGLISTICIFLLLAFTIFVPDQVTKIVNAFEILKSLIGSCGGG